MKYLFQSAAAVALMTGTAFAGNLEATPVEAGVAPVEAPTAASPNWTGFYAGGQFGYANVDIGTPFGSIDESGVVGGLVAGYDYDLGDWVIGAGFDYDWTDVSFAGGLVEFDSIWRLKLRGGYKIANGLLYATSGYAQGEATALGVSDQGDAYFVGGGYEHMINQNFSLGGEVLYHDFDVTGGSIEATTAQVRATFRF